MNDVDLKIKFNIVLLPSIIIQKKSQTKLFVIFFVDNLKNIFYQKKCFDVAIRLRQYQFQEQ